MKKLVTSWKNTQQALGYKVVWERFWKAKPRRRSNPNRDQAKQSQQYQTLEPRQLLAGDVFGATAMFDQLQAEAVAQWSFDESSGDVVHGVSDNNGVIQSNDGPNDNWEIGLGVSGNAVSLNGDGDYVDVSLAANDVSGDFSVSGWFKRDGALGSDEAILGIDKDPLDTSGNQLSLFVLSSGELAIHETNDTDSGWRISSSGQVVDGEWHHVSITRDNGQLSLFLDGQQQGSTYLSLFEFSPTDRWSLGQEFDGVTPDHSFEGVVDDFRVFDGALTETEVKLLSTGLDDHLVVSSLSSSEDGDYRPFKLSLPEALALADEIDGADRISINKIGLIQLSSTLELDSHVSIEGRSPDTLLIASSSGPVFDVTAAASLSGITVNGAYGSSGVGVLSSGDLTLDNVIITGGQTGGKGGGVHQSGGALTISNSRFENNVGGEGGGAVYAIDADVRIENSTFLDNRSTSGSPSLSVEGALSSVFVASSTFVNNKTGTYDHSPDISIGTPAIGISEFYGTNLTMAALEGYGGYYTATSGISVFADDAQIHNSILVGGWFSDLHMQGDFTSLSHNIIGTTQMDLPPTNQVLPRAYPNVDPTYDMFVFESGYSGKVVLSGDGVAKTAKLRVGNPAMNAGSDDKAVDPADEKPIQTDQLGNPRFIGQVDIGAEERLLNVSLAAGLLTIDNQHGGEDSIELSVVYTGEQILVAINGETTDVLAEQVERINILGSGRDETIDLSGVNSFAFPNLEATGDAVTVYAYGGDDKVFGPETTFSKIWGG